jgi:hypothetical protein
MKLTRRENGARGIIETEYTPDEELAELLRRLVALLDESPGKDRGPGMGHLENVHVDRAAVPAATITEDQIGGSGPTAGSP